MKMKKENILEYLESNLKSHEDDVCDSSDRLVWISDVADVIFKLLHEKEIEGYTEIVKAIEKSLFKSDETMKYVKQYIEKYPDGVYTKAFTSIINKEKIKLTLK